ncbi:MAG: hypothetical protein V1493_05575 [Candidatus Diapherotrites archaeon]
MSDKLLAKKEKEKLMAEGYRKTAKENEALCREMDSASSEAWALLEPYDFNAPTRSCRKQCRK